MRANVVSAVLLAAGLAAGCASSGSSRDRDDDAFRLEPGERVEVVYRDGGVVLTLRNEGWMSAATAYSEPDGSLHLKIASDEDMARLVKALELLEFFEGTAPAPRPRARATLTLRRNGRTEVYSRLPPSLSSAEELQRFNRCVAAFRTIYDSTTSFHSVRGIDAGDLEAANRRLQRDASERGGARR